MFTAAANIPIAYLEGKSAEIKATSEEKIAESKARKKLIDATSRHISKEQRIEPEFVQAAGQKAFEKIARERVNINKITAKAVEELAKPEADLAMDTEQEAPSPSEDWLNAFEDEAARISSEEMQILFGKRLAGEIRKPQTYSKRTVKLVSQLDNEVAKLFVLLCSLAIALSFSKDKVFDARVVSFSGSAGQNSLASCGLSFTALNTLEEYGLIISDYDSNADYHGAVAINNSVDYFIYRHGLWLGLVPREPIVSRGELELSGVKLTKESLIKFSSTRSRHIL